ncbi:RDD family protein [Microbacterium allomyrinae]|uniref:RDD family protein n=1 Tax=Microbacterium allomyrinae TaxID=2830666 RepID=A0A9X1S4X0_9MICO|nr:RDD family protein [Microbacterium allomyrinae]MCC2033613.1 RDD family protein [Microbacterium allomyrinae]
MTHLATAPPSLDVDATDSDPALVAALGVVSASTGFRSLAFAIDATIWVVLAAPAVFGAVMLALGDTSFVPVLLIGIGLVLPALFGLLQLIAHGRRGVTVGKAAMRLRSVRESDLGAPGFWHVVLRVLVLWLSGIVPLIGPALMFLSGLWDPQQRGRSILDRVGGCWVIDARAGLDPFDAKAMRHARRELRGRPDQSENLPAMKTGADAESSMRIPDSRSRAGVVGPGSTGAKWPTIAGAGPLEVIAGVPLAGPPSSASEAPIGTVGAPVAPEATPAPAPVPHAAPAPAAPPVQSAPLAPAAPPVQTAPPAQTPPPAVGSPPQGGRRRSQATLRFDDGSVLRAPAFGLIGRDPAPGAGEQVDALVRLEDPQRLLSKTHAAFGQDAEGVWVIDRGSRNGTQLTSPGGDVVTIPAGERTRVPLGWVVHVGGRTFELVARGADS